MSRAFPRPAVAATLALLLLAPAAGAHWYVRHADQSVSRTVPGDGFVLAGAEAHWVVVAPDLSVHRGDGASFEVPAGLPADGTWSVRAEPTRCGPGSHDLAWRLSYKARALPVPACGPVVWAFNWQRTTPFTDGTIAAYGPSLATLDLREAQEPTAYQGATPYYSVDEEDSWSPDYELLAGNSFFLSDRSQPQRDDDGDGVPDRADPDAWPSPWLNQWAARHGLPPWVPSLPRAELLAEDALREAARAAPAAAPLLGERVSYATSSTRGEAPHQSPVQATEVVTLRVHNLDASTALEVAGSVGGPQVLHRRLHDVLVHVPSGYHVDGPATRSLTPPGWAIALWNGEDGRTRVLWQSGPLDGIATGASVEFALQALVHGPPGRRTWDVTLLAGPAAPERRYAFLEAEVVP